MIDEFEELAGPSNLVLAEVTVAGQLLRSIANAVGDAVEPAPVNALDETLPKETVRVAEAVSILQAAAVILPVKLIVPSAAWAIEESSAVLTSKAITGNLNFIYILVLEIIKKMLPLDNWNY